MGAAADWSCAARLLARSAGEAERLILEKLTQVFPDSLPRQMIQYRLIDGSGK
jgi:hypothetical protein